MTVRRMRALFVMLILLLGAAGLTILEVKAQDIVSDYDGDGLVDDADNCPGAINPTQADADGDGFGDACDECDGATSDCARSPTDELTRWDFMRVAAASDSDRDGLSNLADNCVTVANEAQADRDLDGVGDACDLCPDAPARGLTSGCPEASRDRN